MKKLKKTTKKYLKKQERISKRKKLLAWSTIVKERDQNTCQICGIKSGELTKKGKPVVLNAHHIFAKEGAYSYLMFEIENGIALCQNCHRFSRTNSPHRQEFVFFVWLMKNKPEQFEYLKSKIIDLTNLSIEIPQVGK